MEIKDKKVEVLLATFNGEKFIAHQLDSLFQQTYSNFNILVRDDGSSDNTVSILEKYAAQFPGKIQFIKDEKKNVGATQNFAILLEQSTADYIFFCDQDDIWMKDKIELSLKKITALEQGNSRIPCMVYADMKSIDEHGEVISESVWKQLHLHPRFFTLNRLLVQNIPHGCTMVINKAMKALTLPIPSEAILHDHWIALLSVISGRYEAIEQPLVLLRDHAQNVTRKKTTWTNKLKRYFSNLISGETYEHYINIRVQQAQALLNRTQSVNSNEQNNALSEFIRLSTTHGLERKRILWKNKFFRTTFRHTFKMLLRA